MLDSPSSPRWLVATVGTMEAGRLWGFCSMLHPLCMGFSNSFSPKRILRGEKSRYKWSFGICSRLFLYLTEGLALGFVCFSHWSQNGVNEEQWTNFPQKKDGLNSKSEAHRRDLWGGEAKEKWCFPPNLFLGSQHRNPLRVVMVSSPCGRKACDHKTEMAKERYTGWYGVSALTFKSNCTIGLQKGHFGRLPCAGTLLCLPPSHWLYGSSNAAGAG